MELGRIAATNALKGIAPRDPLEGMLAAQMIVTHEAAMDCFRWAHLPGQTFEGRQAALGQANKLVRSYAVLLDALDWHGGKGAAAGGPGRAGHGRGRWAGDRGGGEPEGDGRQSAERSHTQALAHAPEPQMRGLRRQVSELLCLSRKLVEKV